MMDLIATITDKEVLNDDVTKVPTRNREAVRAVLAKDDRLAVLWVSKDNYHKLPGGGIEPGESVKEALDRELLEETGCSASIRKEVGMIIELRAKFDLRQVSYCYVAEVRKVLGEPMFTAKEASKGFELKWMKKEDLLIKMENDTPNSYEGKFILYRDFLFLKKALL